jgi:hypothetical protein
MGERPQHHVALARPPELWDPDVDEAWENSVELRAWAEQLVAAARDRVAQREAEERQEEESRGEGELAGEGQPF